MIFFSCLLYYEIDSFSVVIADNIFKCLLIQPLLLFNQTIKYLIPANNYKCSTNLLGLNVCLFNSCDYNQLLNIFISTSLWNNYHYKIHFL